MRKFISSLILMVTLYLGIHNGYLALWESGQDQPCTVFPYKVALYPKIDRKSLENGIVIHSKQELTQRIEDYTS